MRRPIIAANWKLNKSLKEAQDYARNFGSLANRFRDRDIVLAVPYPFIHAVSKLLEESRIETSAREIYFEEKGAFTGTVSAAMAKDVGATWTLVGHSERRQLFGETLETSAKRMRASLDAGLKPMLCVGETLAEREAGRTADVVGEQLEAALGDLSVEAMSDIAIAYEQSGRLELLQLRRQRRHKRFMEKFVNDLIPWSGVGRVNAYSLRW